MFEMFIGFGMVLAASALGDRTSAMEPCVETLFNHCDRGVEICLQSYCERRCARIEYSTYAVAPRISKRNSRQWNSWIVKA
jgi:hypothetical protein